MTTTQFIVRNITRSRKKIRLFDYPVLYGNNIDLLAIPRVSESDLRFSLLKGDIYRRLIYGDIQVIFSNIDLLQFDDIHKAWLQSVGITEGVEVDTSAGSTLSIEDEGSELVPDKNRLNIVGPGIRASTEPENQYAADITVSTGLPGSILIGDVASEGDADALARSNHTHALAAPGVPEDITKSTALAGSSTTPARSDHKHNILTNTPIAIAIGDTAYEGVDTSLARSDHRHTVLSGAPVSIGIINDSGNATTFSRSDHIHETTFSAVDNALSLADSDISINNQNITNVGTINGTRDYGPQPTNPSSPAPIAGDRYFNTALAVPMEYDGIRFKWLGVADPPVYSGTAGDTAAGSYFRGMDGMAFSVDRGIPIYKSTLTGVLISMTTSVTSDVEVIIDSTVIATIHVVSAGLISNLTLNADFEQGLMKFRNKSTGDTMTNVHITAYFKRRA